MENERTVGTDEVCRLLEISRPTLYRWVRDGRLRGVKVGRRLLFRVDEIRGLTADPAAATHPTATADPAVAAEQAARDTTEAARALLLAGVWRRGSAELHVDPGATDPGAAGPRVQMRLDGRLVPVEGLPDGDARDALVRALCELTGLPGTATRGGRPTSARSFVRAGDRGLDVIASAYPTPIGDALTFRLQHPAGDMRSLEEIGFDAATAAALRDALGEPGRLIVIDGGTDSGKTTTLYALLHELAASGLRVMTAEETVERLVPGVIQGEAVGDSGDGRSGDGGSGGEGFQELLRAMLVGGADVLMAGEVRDAETLRLLQQAAASGRRALTALHARSAFGALRRVLDLGAVSASLTAETLVCVLHQRLVRKSCKGCRRLVPLERADAARLGIDEPSRRGAQVAVNDGCGACDSTGLRGRTVVWELLRVTPELVRGVSAGVPDAALADAAGEGYVPLSRSVATRLLAGEVSLDEALAAL